MAAIVGFTACPTAPAPKPPAPVTLELPTEFGSAEGWATETEAVVAGAWTIDAHITQQAPSGPPLRVRAEVDVEVPQAATDAIIIKKSRVEPSALGAPVAGGWPHSFLRVVSSKASLEGWLRTPPVTPPGCSLPTRKVVATWRRSGPRWIVEASVDGRKAVTGWLNQDAGSGLLTGGKIRALRWFPFEGERCTFEQTERYDLEFQATP